MLTTSESVDTFAAWSSAPQHTDTKLNIEAHGQNIPDAILSFKHDSIPDAITAAASKLDFSTPTPIQAQAWPIVLADRDLIGVAETGSGKTAAFVVPMLIHVLRTQRKDNPSSTPQNTGPVVLVIAPTRELATQIDAEVYAFGHGLNVRHTCVYGGVQKAAQIRDLRAGVDILVATPGRLLDLLSAKATTLDAVQCLVLDEADRLLSMGFRPQLRQIADAVPAARQTLLWSATWTNDVQQVAMELLRSDAVKVVAAGAGLKPGDAIMQRFALSQQDHKYDVLAKLLDHEWDGSRMLCFVATRERVDELVTALRHDSWPALGMHGRKAQLERMWVLEEFREGSSPILVATDVAARGLGALAVFYRYISVHGYSCNVSQAQLVAGLVAKRRILDIKDVKVVINYDMPTDVRWCVIGSAEPPLQLNAWYIQRIGRTGRAGSRGLAISFVEPEEKALAKELMSLMYESGQDVPTELVHIAASLQAVSDTA